MVKLQHRNRRDGGISVGGCWYELDQTGCVEVSEEHAECMLQGALWKKYGGWEEVAAQETIEIKGGARRVRTREELLLAAKDQGIEIEEPRLDSEELKTETKEIEVSLSLRKAELLKIAKNLGISVQASMPKRSIFKLIQKESNTING